MLRIDLARWKLFSLHNLKMKQTRFALILFLLPLCSWGQTEFYRSVGIGIYYGASRSSTAADYPLVYSPRVNILKIGNDRLSIGTHIGFGIDFILRYREFRQIRNGFFRTQHGAQQSLDLPFMIEYHSGFGASPDSKETYGYFFGAGVGINTMAGPFGENNSIGSVMNVGIRTYMAGVPIELRASYLNPVVNDFGHVFSMSASYMFGYKKPKPKKSKS